MLCHGVLLVWGATVTQVQQKRVLRGQEGVFIDHLQSRADSDWCMVVVMVVVMMVSWDIRPTVDPEQRLPLWAISYSQLQASATRLQGLDQSSKICSSMDLVIQQVGAV